MGNVVAGQGIESLSQAIQCIGNEPKVYQRQQVAQLEGGALDTIKSICIKIGEFIANRHNDKSLAFLLNLLNLLTIAVRYARQDSSVGAQFGSAFLSLALAVDAAVTAVQEWNAATGEGKDLWKKRVDAIEKVSTMLVIATTAIAIPINPTVGAFIGAIGVGGIKVLRSGYDVAANFIWGSAPAAVGEGSSLI